MKLQGSISHGNKNWFDKLGRLGNGDFRQDFLIAPYLIMHTILQLKLFMFAVCVSMKVAEYIIKYKSFILMSQKQPCLINNIEPI